MEKQTEYNHLESHNNNAQAIKWKILHANIANDAEGIYIEAFEITETLWRLDELLYW